MVVEIFCVFVCHMTLQDRATKALYDFFVRISSREITILPSTVAIDTMIMKM